jgi:arylsulfatase A-like enzyme
MFKDVKFPPASNYSDKLDPHGDGWSNMKKSPEMVEKWMRVYYAMTANLDWNVGRLLEALEKAGIADNTVFVFTSDHGEMFGAQGRMKKNIFYEEAARIPFLIRWPKKIKPATRCDAALGTVDIMPTLLGMMGLKIPAKVEGMDISRRAMGLEGPEPQAAFLQNTGACAIWANGHEWRALRDKRYTYAIFRKDKQELLFDNTNDPFQMKNLIDAPAHKATAERFRKMLAGKMKSLNDTFPESTWYRDNWTKNRIILRGAKG